MQLPSAFVRPVPALPKDDILRVIRTSAADPDIYLFLYFQFGIMITDHNAMAVASYEITGVKTLAPTESSPLY